MKLTNSNKDVKIVSMKVVVEVANAERRRIWMCFEDLSNIKAKFLDSMNA